MNISCLLAVKDIAAARAFYEELFSMTVAFDFGRNIAFDCGLSLQEDFDWLTGIPKSEIKARANNFELYFEIAELDAFVEKLKARGDCELLHDLKTYPWQQRVMRFYDLDKHLIEVGEPMNTVVLRLQKEGLSLEEVAAKMDVTLADVERMLVK